APFRFSHRPGGVLLFGGGAFAPSMLRFRADELQFFRPQGPIDSTLGVPPLPQLWLRPDRLRPSHPTQIPISIIAARVPERRCIQRLGISSPILFAFRAARVFFHVRPANGTRGRCGWRRSKPLVPNFKDNQLRRRGLVLSLLLLF